MRTATVIAANDLRCYRLTPLDFRTPVEGNAAIAWNLLQSMVEHSGSSAPEADHDRARLAAVEAGVVLALNGLRVHPAHAGLDEPGPHAAVDVHDFRTFREERPQRARGRRDHRRGALDAVEHCVEAERSNRRADAFERIDEPGAASQTGGACEVAAELLPNATERLLAAVGG